MCIRRSVIFSTAEALIVSVILQRELLHHLHGIYKPPVTGASRTAAARANHPVTHLSQFSYVWVFPV